ncbi:hypothetical protein [Trinickia sp.]|uniref:hypothetical protein n=1 Tax=Trinickia sp. TaxID=2571163 RepID=UPI003F8089DB
MKRRYQAACFIPLCLASGLCMAGYGDDSEAAELLVDLATFELIWAGITLVFFVFLPLILRRKLSFDRRFGYTLLFWIAQIAYPFVKGPAIDLFGKPGSSVIVTASKTPLVLQGVTFPAGSRAEYELLGWGFWRRKLVGVTSTKPVKLGPLDITALSVRGSYEGAGTIASATLVRPTVIDGWPCDVDVTLELDAGAPRLGACDLHASRTLGNLTWPEGTGVLNLDERGWSLSWRGNEPYPKLLGFSVSSMTADYGASLQLAEWKAQASGQGAKLGDYAFDGDVGLRVTWEAPQEIRVAGYGKNVKTGAEADCVLTRIEDRASRPCDSRPDSHTDNPSADANAAETVGHNDE